LPFPGDGENNKPASVCYSATPTPFFKGLILTLLTAEGPCRFFRHFRLQNTVINAGFMLFNDIYYGILRFVAVSCGFITGSDPMMERKVHAAFSPQFFP
jgi:hypothetical protein